MELPEALLRDLERMNPWWRGEPQKPLPATRRHLVAAIHRRLKHRLAPIVAVRGPRQVGKTTAQLQVIQDLLDGGIPVRRIFAVQFDDLSDRPFDEPILRLVDWYQTAVLGKSLNRAAHDGEATFLVFDEVQNLPHWAEQLKSLVDHAETTVLVTGSSALRIEAGRESLAGRITTLEAGVLSLTEIARFHGLDLGAPALPDNGLEPLSRQDFWQSLAEHGRGLDARDETFRRFAARGGYPLVHLRWQVPWPLVKDQLNETVVRRVIRHDLQGESEGGPGDSLLVEEVFRLACRYAGQAPGSRLLAGEVQRALAGDVGEMRVREALQRLAETLLIRQIRPLEIRSKRSGGHPKLCLADHGLRASWLQEDVPLDPEGLERQPESSALAGHLAESVVGATLSTIPGLDLAWWPQRKDEAEIDFVLTIGTLRIPLEVKYQRRLDPRRDAEALCRFLDRQPEPSPFGLLITRTDDVEPPDPRIVALPLASLLLLR